MQKLAETRPNPGMAGFAIFWEDGSMTTGPHLASVMPRLPVNDLRRTLDFYRGQLGFSADVLWPEEEPTFAILRKDMTRLAFFEPTEHQPGPIGYAELSMETRGCMELHEILKGRMPVEWGPEVYSYGRREFAVRDPDGYLIIFTEETDEEPTTSEPGDEE